MKSTGEGTGGAAPPAFEWDRGTLIVDGPGPGVRWDERTRCWRAPPWRYRELGGRGVVDESVRVGVAPDLRPYQADALAEWERAGRLGTIVLPTGAGKTRIAVAAVARTGLPTIVLAPTRAVMDQWVRAFPEAGQVGDGVHDVRRVTVATTASARLYADRLGPRFGLLVADEVHHLVGQDEVLELYPAPARLGLTATPPTDRERLDRLVGPIVYRMGVEELAGRWLAPFEVVRIPVRLSDAELEAYRADQRTFRGVFDDWSGSWAEFVRTASRSASGREALAAWRRGRERVAYPPAKAEAVGRVLQAHAGARVLVFARDNAIAYAIARDWLVAPLTCDIGRAERERTLTAFAEGRLRGIVSARVLNEGVDVPAADVAVITGGSQGVTEYVQRVGRVLRPAEGKRAFVYEIVCQGTHEVGAIERGRRELVG